MPEESDAERLSRLLWEARELVEMFGDVVASRTGSRSDWAIRVREEIDAYRAEQGWPPHGFGHERPLRLVCPRCDLTGDLDTFLE